MTLWTIRKHYDGDGWIVRSPDTLLWGSWFSWFVSWREAMNYVQEYQRTYSGGIQVKLSAPLFLEVVADYFDAQDEPGEGTEVQDRLRAIAKWIEDQHE